jgi:prolyl-tRNA synthetase
MGVKEVICDCKTRLLLESGDATLLDDRDERPGVKFADMELIGIPLQIILKKSVKGS